MNSTTTLLEAPAAPSKAECRLAVNLALASRILSREGHDDLNQGQVSGRLPDSDRFQIKSALVGFSEASPEDMVRVALDPDAVADPMAPPELPLHLAVYEARDGVGAIVHSHAPHALVFGATDLDLKSISHDGAFFTGRIPRFTQTSNTVLDIETGRAIAAALGDAPAAFLQNHGLLAVGKTVREATIVAGLLERAAKLQLLAESVGVPYTVANAEDVDKKREFVYSGTAVKSYWEYSVREVRASNPETAVW